MPCAWASDVKEPISVSRDCSLSITYRCGTEALSGETVRLYQIASANTDAQYTLTDAFAASNVQFNNISTNGEWNVLRSTLESYILANNVSPTQTAVTDANGRVRFTQLKAGIYLVSAVRAKQSGVNYLFDALLLAVPSADENGNWHYDITAKVKGESLPPSPPDHKLEYRVLKLWKGDDGRIDRPQSIEAELFRDGESYKTVVLSEENHWSYSWTVKDDGSVWSVAERNVPEGYTVTVEKRDTTFVLTNSRTEQPPKDPNEPNDPNDPNEPNVPNVPTVEGVTTEPSPYTGDTSNVLLYAVLMFVSGAVLLIVGMMGKRKNHEETN